MGMQKPIHWMDGWMHAWMNKTRATALPLLFLLLSFVFPKLSLAFNKSVAWKNNVSLYPIKFETLKLFIYSGARIPKFVSLVPLSLLSLCKF